MAFYALQFQQLKAEAEHAISGLPDARTSLDRIVNGALEYLTNLHAWTWRQAMAALDLAAGQGAVLLPEDFGEMVDLVGQQAVRLAPMQAIARVRVNGALAGGFVLVRVSQQPQTAPDQVPRRILELAPVPQADAAAALTLCYRRLTPLLVNATDVPAIPYGMHDLLRTLVRAYAVSSTQQQAGHDWQLFNQQIGSYIAADSMAQGQPGTLVCTIPYFQGEGEIPLGVEIKTPYD